MRKTLIAVLAALTSLAVAAVALAQNPAPIVDVTAKVFPGKAGTKKNPRSARVNLLIKNSEESRSSASKIEIRFPKSLKVSTRGLKKCSVSKLNSQGKASCPRASKAGVGTALANVNPNDPTPAQLKFNVTAFVAGKNRLAFYLEEQGNPNGVQQALPAKLSSMRHKVYGQKLVIAIPENLQQPAPGVFSALVEIEASLGLRSGGNRLISSVACPRAREHQIGVKIDYVPNPNPPAASSVTTADGAPCTGKS